MVGGMAGELKEFFRSDDDRADFVALGVAPFVFVLWEDISHPGELNATIGFHVTGNLR